jgi:hypothetical protein
MRLLQALPSWGHSDLHQCQVNPFPVTFKKIYLFWLIKQGTPYEDEGRDKTQVSTSQGTPKIGGKPSEATDKHGVSSPSEPLILDFQPTELLDNTFLLFKAPRL